MPECRALGRNPGNYLNDVALGLHQAEGIVDFSRGRLIDQGVDDIVSTVPAVEQWSHHAVEFAPEDEMPLLREQEDALRLDDLNVKGWLEDRALDHLGALSGNNQNY